MKGISACPAEIFIFLLHSKIHFDDAVIGFVLCLVDSRLYVGLCGAEGNIEQARVLGYWVVRCRYLSYVTLMLTVTAAWPAAFSRSGTGETKVSCFRQCQKIIPLSYNV